MQIIDHQSIGLFCALQKKTFVVVALVVRIDHKCEHFPNNSTHVLIILDKHLQCSRHKAPADLVSLASNMPNSHIVFHCTRIVMFFRQTHQCVRCPRQNSTRNSGAAIEQIVWVGSWHSNQHWRPPRDRYHMPSSVWKLVQERPLARSYFE